MREKPRRAVISEILDQVCLGPMIIPRSKLLRSHVLTILTFNRTATECLGASLSALYSKPQPRDSLSVGTIHFRERGRVPNKLAGECMYCTFVYF